MSDLQALLDQIDMLEGELLPDWKYNARTGAVIANAYRKVGDKWSCLVAKDIPAEPDGEFIALARTALPQLAKALRAVIDTHQKTEHQRRYGFPRADKWEHYCIEDDQSWPCATVQAITDALGADHAT